MKLKGYIFSRPFLKERVPQHIQNIVIRDYCKKKNISYLMSATEYSVEGSSYILSEIIDNLKNYDGIIFYSLFQLPFLKLDRYNIYRIIIKKKKQLHFVVENLVAKNKITFLEIEKIFLLKLQTLNVENSVNKLGELKNYVTLNHKKTSRNYIERMNNNKIECMIVSKKYDYDYWDGDRKFGYGGYKYIKNYHTLIAEKLIKDYQLNNKSRILDIGCGKGFLMYELKKILKNNNIFGIDKSIYAKKWSKKEVKKNIKIWDINNKLEFKDNFFDLVISINTLHNLKIKNVNNCLTEIERVGRNKYICVESYRNEKEQFNLQCWALTAETLLDVTSWEWLFKNSGYKGDYEFIFFE
jgi:sporadic carbohydrate cluster protein (TIGR04323 family)